MIIDYDEIREVDLSRLIKIVSKKHRDIVNGEAGKEHYKLLAYLGKITKGLIIELGTHYGTSSMALAENPSNIIITYDVRDIYKIKHQPKNVFRIIGNIFELGEERMLLKSDLIFLDTAHKADFEWQVFCFLKENNYKGVLLVDDIYFSDEMLTFWNKIDVLKYDLTDIGHGGGIAPGGNITGTGLVDFTGEVIINK